MCPAADLRGYAARRVLIPAVPGEASQQQLLGQDVRDRARPLPLFRRALPHLLMAADAQLLGRVTYEGFAKAWPAMEDPVGFASKMNAMPKYVVSATLTDPAWTHTTVITLEQAGKLKDQYAGDILVAGSGQLVRALTGLGLVDEYRLMVFPLVLGTGKRLFDGAARTPLTLADITRIGPDGVTIQRYTPA